MYISFRLCSDVIQNDPSCCGVRQGERGLKTFLIFLDSSIAVPRSITGCGVSYIGEVSRSDGGVENAIVSVCLYWIYPFLPCRVP